ncbi:MULTISPECIES: hypothetical protein [Vibrio]|uniref:Uncharacterized protein n=1 Tax=Vibrio kanaloae TaxID=170673 RepID=A0ABV4LET1_9VIBR|nr:hypothetical protein [Vibrio kanaloae]OEF15666.1 hypothetical protein A132_17595 [Vibrio kanaloae 5S-149]
MIKTTMIYRHVNYRKSAALTKSLKHSLRIKSNKFKCNEWVDLLAENNWVFTENNPQGIRLSERSEEARSSFISQLISEEFAPKKIPTEVKSNYKKYEYKLNKKILSASSSGDEHLAEQLMLIRDRKPENYKEIIESISGVKRRNQLINMLDIFMDLSKKVEGCEDGRAAKMHEAFFKFPHRHGAVVEPKRMAECIRSFYAKYLPDYPIRLLVVHDDERSVDMKTGAHPHIFLSTKNSKTGKRDLCAAIRETANRYLRAKPTEVSLWNPETRRHEKQTISSIDSSLVGGLAASKIQGIIVQDMFMDHVRTNFQELDVRWTKSRVRKVMSFHRQYENAKKPKADRLYNLNQLLALHNQRLVKEHKTRNEEKKLGNETLFEIERKVADEEGHLNKVRLSIDAKEAELDSLKDCIRKVRKILTMFLIPYKKLIESIAANDQAKAINSANDCLYHHYDATPEAKKVIVETVRADAEAINSLCVDKDVIGVFNNIHGQIESGTPKNNPTPNVPRMRPRF